MRVYRLCRSSWPPYDGEGAKRAGGRWNSKGNRVVYMSENRSLAVFEILAHWSDVLPADIPDHISPEFLTDRDLPEKWSTLEVEEQGATRQLGDDWLMRKSSVALSIPSVTSGERNFLLNPDHPQFRDLRFHSPVPFRFDARLLKMPADGIRSRKPRSH